jgi:hypothetical protein
LGGVFTIGIAEEDSSGTCIAPEQRRNVSRQIREEMYHARVLEYGRIQSTAPVVFSVVRGGEKKCVFYPA